MRTIRTAIRRRKFLDALAQGWSVTKACRSARMARNAAYEWRADDPEFAKAWDEAIEAGTDTLEDEVVRRARDGTLKPVFHRGMKVGSIREYSDTLAIFTLKARRPEKFKDRSVVEHDVTDRLAERLEQARKRTRGQGGN